ncbi:hypothetical protein J6590_096797 [Homalodisca vitripennis]|nr:hypothetical protein J6590_096797 [Homalodisca vitripennis]
MAGISRFGRRRLSRPVMRWQSHQGQALGKRLLADSSSGFTRWLMGLGRDRVKQVIVLITGHGHFRKHLNTLGLRNEDSECRLCNKSEETAKHIILDCERLGARRRALFGDKQPGDEPDAIISRSRLDLLNYPCTPESRHLLCPVLGSTGRYKPARSDPSWVRKYLEGEEIIMHESRSFLNEVDF